MQSLFGAEIFFHISVLEYFPEWYVENISWTWNPIRYYFRGREIISCIVYSKREHDYIGISEYLRW